MQTTHLLASSDEIKKQIPLVHKATEQGLAILTESRLLETVSASGTSTPNLTTPSKFRSSRLSESGNTLIVNSPFSATQLSFEESDGSAPTITLLLPDNGLFHHLFVKLCIASQLVLPFLGPNTGDFKIAVFGLGFAAGPGFKIRFGLCFS